MDEQHKTTRRVGQGRAGYQQDKARRPPPNPIPSSISIHAGAEAQSRAGMTSCPPPPPHEHEHQQRKPPALELLDEYWFFNNTLSKSNNKPPKPGRGQYKQQGSSSAGPPPSGDRRRLLRTPSLPSPGRVSRQGDDLQVEVVEHGAGNQQKQDQEVEDDDLNWSSIYEGVLRTRMAEGGGAAGSSSSSSRPRPAALRRAPSMPVPGGPASSTQQMSSKPTPPPARGSNKPRQKQPVLMLARSRSTMFHDDKKWRSSSDLESIEVQGFRDLGFVFDKEDLRDSLAGVLPGLKPAANSRSTRPYLSEAWQQRPPALLRVQSEARSAAEVKDQLRMWAQAVACNARQEC
ncbi:unnamed protein product [Urochloa humidicola]